MIRWPAYLVIAGAFATVQAAAAYKAPAAVASVALTELEGDEEAGREIYVEDCRACHSGAIAPALKGLTSRPIASAPGYNYSEGLKQKAQGDASWTEAELDAYLADPRGYAPGSKMVLKVQDAQARADLIAFLKTM